MVESNIEMGKNELIAFSRKAVFTMKSQNAPEQVILLKKRIGYLREVLDMSVEEVSSRIGITPELYNEYENGEEDIPISVIYTLAAIFGVDPTEILTGDTPKVEEFSVTRKGTGVKVKRYVGYDFESLAFNYIGRNKEPMLVTIAPSNEAPDLVSHSGQEFNFVVSGKIGVTIGDKTMFLSEGDCIYFDANNPHGQFAVGDVAKFLTVIDID